METKSKSKKVLKGILISALSLIIVVAIVCGGVVLFYVPTLKFDASKTTGDVTKGASGYLYGIAEDGVPSYNMVESVDVSSVVAKTANGLQHPIGDVNNVSNELSASASSKYVVVYLQDMYNTWYYDHENIEAMKKAGTYDWKTYVEETYFPLIEETVSSMKDASYKDKLVYCPYNECDNAVWFGTWVNDNSNENGGYSKFDDAGKKNFYEAWKMTCDFIKTLDPDAKFGGPGYCDYNKSEITGFLSYCKSTNTVPDVIIYHELGYRSAYDLSYNAEELRKIEDSMGLDSSALPIIISEYGQMEDNGNPNTMLKYITRIEEAKVYGDNAFWRLADNLCDVSADGNTPNSNWWAYRWYTDLEGETVSSKTTDFFHSDFKKAISSKRGIRYRQYMGLTALNNDKDEMTTLVSGADYDGEILYQNLDATNLYGKTINVSIESVGYEGLSGEVYKPEKVQSYNTFCVEELRVNMDFMNNDSIYKITLREADESDDVDFMNQNLATRYEFEDGTLLGSAYTYDSAYATTGDKSGLVGGMEKAGDGVEITVNAPEDGTYDLTLIYGNGNDGVADENGKQNPLDRKTSTSVFSIDGTEETLSFDNTIKSEYTNSKKLQYDLTKGEHKIKLSYDSGTIVLDSLLLKKSEESTGLYVMKDKDRTTDSVTSFLVIADKNGYFDVNTSAKTKVFVNGLSSKTDGDGNGTFYLQKGLNYIDVLTKNASFLSATPSETEGKVIELNPETASLDGDAKLNTDTDVANIEGISSNSGEAVYVVNSGVKKTYKLTITYSNNDENGVHDYNVDLVEDYITLSVNGKKQGNIYCRNTYSFDNYTTVTTDITLKRGRNVITLFNDGEKKFNNGVSYAPRIANVTINSIDA